MSLLQEYKILSTTMDNWGPDFRELISHILKEKSYPQIIVDISPFSYEIFCSVVLGNIVAGSLKIHKRIFWRPKKCTKMSP